jgi:hypothetical protein
MDDFSRDAFREREAKAIIRRRAFILHLAVFLATNVFLFVIWAVTGAGFPWFIFPFFGWGIGIVAHFVSLLLGDPNEIVLEREQRRLAANDDPPW